MGSVVALSDVNSVIVERYSYDVFGEPNTTSDANNPYFFTARRLDTETGLYYYRARYYAYDIGRFLQTDPKGFIDGLNLYVYVFNTPTTNIDPYGTEIYVIGDDSYKKKVENNLLKLKNDDMIMRQKIEKLERSKHLHFIANTSRGNESITLDPFGESLLTVGSGTLTLWSPENYFGWGKRDPRVGLAHELDHTYRKDTGTMDRRMVDGVRYSEILAIIQENRIRRVTGDPFRYSYGFQDISWEAFIKYRDFEFNDYTNKCKK